MIAEQPAKLAALAEARADYGRLASLLWTSAESPLTMGNHVEILQDARKNARDCCRTCGTLLSRFTCCITSGRPTRSPRTLAGCSRKRSSRALPFGSSTTRWAVSPC